jgi:hypothetical protein
MIQERIQTTIEAEEPIGEVIDALKKVQILGQPEAFPYGDSTIELEEINLSDIRPMALYIVRRGLARQFALRNNLLALGHDTLHLDSALHISQGDTPARLIPPIVEETGDGLCLMDGLHRAMVARSIGEKTMKVLHITNVSPEYPLSSYPNDWDEVIEYDATPVDPSLKKRYRPDHYFFRDLSGINGNKHREGGDAS